MKILIFGLAMLLCGCSLHSSAITEEDQVLCSPKTGNAYFVRGYIPGNDSYFINRVPAIDPTCKIEGKK